MKKPARAEIQEMRAVTMDGSTIDLRIKVTEGPDSILDKSMSCMLTRKHIEQIMQIYNKGKE